MKSLTSRRFCQLCRLPTDGVSSPDERFTGSLSVYELWTLKANNTSVTLKSEY